jgi:hypothetical protein
MRDFSKIIETARVHYINLKDDISNAANRIEHIRLSALAQEAHNLLTDLVAFELGLVYSHTNNTDAYVSSLVLEDPSSTFDEPLDLPEFKSPFNPDA